MRADQFASEGVVNIFLSQEHHISCEIDSQTDNGWRLNIKSENATQLSDGEYTTVAFSENHQIHIGKSKILHVNKDELKILVSKPEKTITREIESPHQPRTKLSTSIIVMGASTTEKRFIPRTENCIVDLGLQKAKLVCKSTLDKSNSDIMLLTCLDNDDPTNPEKQIYIHAKSILDAGTSPLSDYPNCYSIEFDLIYPQFKQALTDFVISL